MTIPVIRRLTPGVLWTGFASSKEATSLTAAPTIGRTGPDSRARRRSPASYNRFVSTGPAPRGVTALKVELEDAKRAFHEMADRLTEESWNRASANPGWTNGQVLFHVTLAFMLLPYLVPLGQFLGALPPGWSKTFAAILDAGAPVFHRINSLGPSAAGVAYTRERLLRKYDALHAYAVNSLTRLEPRLLERGMYTPKSGIRCSGDT